MEVRLAFFDVHRESSLNGTARPYGISRMKAPKNHVEVLQKSL
jgi:hypothetical protein